MCPDDSRHSEGTKRAAHLAQKVGDGGGRGMVRPREGKGGGLALGAALGAARGSGGGRLHGQGRDHHQDRGEVRQDGRGQGQVVS